MKTSILHEPESRVLESSEELADSYFQKYAIVPLVFNPEDIWYEIRKEVRRVPAHQRDSFHRYDGDVDWEYETAYISLPIQYNPNLNVIKKLEGNTRTLDGFNSRITYGNTEICYSFDTKWYGGHLDEDAIAAAVNSNSERLLSVITDKNNNIKFENNNFKHQINEIIFQRKSKLITDQEKISTLSSKIKIQQRPKPQVVSSLDEEIHTQPVKTVLGQKNINPQIKVRKYDVFISHASEDKESFVRPLADKLKEEGITVWYDNFELSWGDDLRGSIDKGLENSRYGIVVFSPSFFEKKKWTEHELNGLFAMEEAGRKVVLPVWHNVTRDDVLKYSPSFADRLALRSDKDEILSMVFQLKKLLGK